MQIKDGSWEVPRDYKHCAQTGRPFEVTAENIGGFTRRRSAVCIKFKNNNGLSFAIAAYKLA